jgi:hypothetical protein
LITLMILGEAHKLWICKIETRNRYKLLI